MCARVGVEHQHQHQHQHEAGRVAVAVNLAEAFPRCDGEGDEVAQADILRSSRAAGQASPRRTLGDLRHAYASKFIL